MNNKDSSTDDKLEIVIDEEGLLREGLKEESEVVLLRWRNAWKQDDSWAEAFTRGAYPFKGMAFLLKHVTLQCLVVCPLLLLLMCESLVYVFLFIFVLPPQALAFMTFMSDWAAWTTSTSLVFLYGAVLSFFIGAIITDYYCRSIYDRVFSLRKVPIDSLHTMPKEQRRKLLYFKIGIIVVVLALTYPLNFLPVGGSILYVIINGLAQAWALQAVYLTHKGLNMKDQAKWLSFRSRGYTIFGMIAVMLLLVPILNSVFGFTNVIGAALWATEIEQNKKFQLLRRYVLQKKKMKKLAKNQSAVFAEDQPPVDIVPEEETPAEDPIKPNERTPLI